MVKIEAVIQPSKLECVKRTLDSLGVQVTMSEVLDLGGPNGETGFYRGARYQVTSTKLKLEMLAPSDRADEIVDTLLRAARESGPGDDGTIAVYEVLDAIRIHTGARLQFTLA